MKYIITKTWVIDESEFTAPYHSQALKREMALKLTEFKKPTIKIEKNINYQKAQYANTNRL